MLARLGDVLYWTGCLLGARNEFTTWALPIVARWFSTVRACRCIRQLGPIKREFDAVASMSKAEWPVQLAGFRQRYPQYNHLSDAQLMGKRCLSPILQRAA